MRPPVRPPRVRPASLDDIRREYLKDLSLEDQLRESVAHQERLNAMAHHEDLYAAIEKTRHDLLERVKDLRETRKNMNAQIKAAQDALDALPVPRPRKQFKGRKPRALTPAETEREFERAETSVELFESRDRGAEHLGAHEFPSFEGSMAGAMAEAEERR